MTLSELRERAYEAYGSISPTIVTPFINWAYREICRAWRPTKRLINAVILTPGKIFYALPPDCFHVEQVLLDNDLLRPVKEEWLDAEFPDWRNATDIPEYFFANRRDVSGSSGGQIGFALPPNNVAASKTLELVYSYIPDALNSDSDEPILPSHLHDAIWIGAVWRYADSDGEKGRETANRYAVLWQRWLDDVRQDADESHARSIKGGGRRIRPYLI
jgi:hypothetical protein